MQAQDGGCNMQEPCSHDTTMVITYDSTLEVATPIYDPIMQGQGLGIQAVYMFKHTFRLVSITKRILYMSEKLLAK